MARSLRGTGEMLKDIVGSDSVGANSSELPQLLAHLSSVFVCFRGHALAMAYTSAPPVRMRSTGCQGSFKHLCGSATLYLFEKRKR